MRVEQIQLIPRNLTANLILKLLIVSSGSGRIYLNKG